MVTQPSAPVEASQGALSHTTRWQAALTYVVVTLGAAVMIFPFVWMVLTSFKSLEESNRFPPTLLPETWHPENYIEAWNRPTGTLGRYLLNSLIIAVSGTAAQVLICTLAAYAFAQLRFKGRDALFMLVLATTMIPNEITLIPNFVAIRRFPLFGGNDLFGQGGSGLYDTYIAIVLPGLAGAFTIFLLRQTFMQIPREFWEAAQIDGCGSLDYLVRVLAPMASASIFTIAIFGFIGRWNALLWPLIVTRSEAVRPVQVAMIFFQDEFVTNFAVVMAAAILVTLPIIVIFLLVQRQFIAGIVSSGLKG
jgi:multiple sugar transport system permease protein